MRRVFAFLLICLVCLTGLAEVAFDLRPALAQSAEVETPDYANWEKVVDRAQRAIDADLASDAALEALRIELVDWRQGFQTAQNGDQLREKTLQDQLDALGPVAQEGAEPREIAERRTALADQLARMRLPLVQAQEAYLQADGLIAELDAALRTRQADALLRLGPSPLNPAHWSLLVSTVSQVGTILGSEFSAVVSNATERRAFRDRLPLALVLLLISAVLIGRGNVWSERAVSIARNRRQKPVFRLLSFLFSTGKVLLPFAGVMVLVHALGQSGVTGLHLGGVFSAVPGAALAFLVARWLGIRIFPKQDTDQPYLNLSEDENRGGRVASAVLGATLGVKLLIEPMTGWSNVDPVSLVVVNFILLAIEAVALLRLGQLLRRHFGQSQEAQQIWPRIGNGMSWLVITAASVGVLLASIGYLSLGSMLVFSTAQSLALLAFLKILHRLITVLFELVSPSKEDNEPLSSVLVRFAFTLVSLPGFALIWGVRTSTLWDWWGRFIDGVSIGDVKISPANFVTFAVLFCVGYVATKLIQSSLRNSVLPKTKLDAGGRNAIVVGAGYTGIFLAAVVAITGAGIDLSSLAIVAGALSVGIGFGLQTIVSNFVSGIILLIERPISEGDWIEVSGQAGYVRDISVRSTRIETFDRADLIIPNADLISGVVKNVTKGNDVGRVIVPVGVAYGTDTKLVERILMEIAQAHPMVLSDPEPSVIFRGLGASSLDFEIRAFLRDVNWIMNALSDMNHEIVRRFDEAGIAIPFPQQDVWLRMADGSSKTISSGNTLIDRRTEANPTARDTSDAANDGGME